QTILFLIPEKSGDYDGFFPNTLKGVALTAHALLDSTLCKQRSIGLLLVVGLHQQRRGAQGQPSQGFFDRKTHFLLLIQ
ncbi:hypothetical protein, partial [Simplicispira metamorpha]